MDLVDLTSANWVRQNGGGVCPLFTTLLLIQFDGKLNIVYILIYYNIIIINVFKLNLNLWM